MEVITMQVLNPALDKVGVENAVKANNLTLTEMVTLFLSRAVQSWTVSGASVAA